MRRDEDRKALATAAEAWAESDFHRAAMALDIRYNQADNLRALLADAFEAGARWAEARR